MPDHILCLCLAAIMTNCGFEMDKASHIVLFTAFRYYYGIYDYVVKFVVAVLTPFKWGALTKCHEPFPFYVS